MHVSVAFVSNQFLFKTTRHVIFETEGGKM